MSIIYIGGFPPPFGGVTKKNQNLYIALLEHLKIEKIDLNEIKRKNLVETVKLIRVLLNRRNCFVVGVASKKSGKKFCKLLYFVNRKAMRKSINFLMGGTAANDIVNDREYQKYISQFKRVYAETHGMVEALKKAGLENAAYYPNCRFRPENVLPELRNDNHTLRAVFFSLISPEKGIDIVIAAATLLQNTEFHIYGEIKDGFETEFLASIASLPNINYHGVFKGKDEQVYHELSKYDVLLLPSRWKYEGVPGILVESKIAGIPAVVSNIAYNAEIVNDGVDGIVLKENTAEALSKALLYLDENRSVLSKLKIGAKSSAEHYYIDNYIGEIVGEFTKSL